MAAHSAPRISIVIPAYKAAFLGAALESLARQTLLPFEVVVADDASPHELKAICDTFATRVPLRYQRFSDNLGSRSLVLHWARGVAMAQGDWIWLMGDDDELEPGCVAAMQAIIAASDGRPRLWRLDTLQIDGEGRFLRDCDPYPDRLPTLAYLRGRMAGRLWSFACEYVFRKDAFIAAGGFVEFPLAWCSDDATWVRLSGSAGGEIVTVRGPHARARYRMSTLNISSAGPELNGQKLQARLLYLEWLDGSEGQGWLGCRLSREAALGAEALQWFLRTLYSTRTVLPPALWYAAVRRLAASTGVPLWRVAWEMARIQHWVRAALTNSTAR